MPRCSDSFPSFFNERRTKMGWMIRFELRGIALTAVIALAAVGCSGGGASVDKAGGAGEPVVLRMASTYGDLGDLPAVQYFVDRVGKLSGGHVRIEVVDSWGGFASDAEQQVVRDVAAGEVDLGWVGTRVFDTMGVRSFQALTAPMLVDSYALENGLIESGVTEQMMRGLDDVGVVGLGVLADGLRKPIGIAGYILGPADWRGITFGTLRSKGQADAIRALGATPAFVLRPELEGAFDEGTIHGFETNLFNYARDPAWLALAPYVTANVSLWPQMDVLFANPVRFAALPAEERGWLQEAARGAAARSTALADTDARSMRNACEAGARFADASEAELAALREAFAPVYADLRQDAETKAFIERIGALKESTPAEARLTITPACTGKAPEQPAIVTGDSPAFLNGTYRFVITLDEAREADMVDPEDEYPIVDTMVLEDGHLEGGCFGSAGATYAVEDDRISFYSVEYGDTATVTFTRDDQGNLHLTPVPPMDPGGAFQCFSQVWMKIG
jgi:TRAP-type C4-dicarboxylate transport system substrate-binding protein